MDMTRPDAKFERSAVLPVGSAGKASVSGMTALSGVLSHADPTSLDPAGCVDALEDLARLKAWADALTARTIERLRSLNHDRLSAPHGHGAELTDTVTALDTALGLRIPERTAARLVQEAYVLTNHQQNTLAALQDGKFSYRHASLIVEEVTSLPAGASSREFEERLLEMASDRTASSLAARARRLRERKHPESIRIRHTRCLQDRRVELYPDQDGMAWLSAYLPAEQACGIYHRLTTQARHLKAWEHSRSAVPRPGSTEVPDSGDVTRGAGTTSTSAETGSSGTSGKRNMTQLRADILADLLTHWCAPECPSAGINADAGAGAGPDTAASKPPGAGSVHRAGPGTGSGPSADPSARPSAEVESGKSQSRRKSLLPGKGVRAEVLITVAAAALIGLTDDPAELEGYGPIPIETARELAAGAQTWRRLLTEPVTGAVLALDRARYKPTKAMRTWLRVRDKTCTVPGCNRTASACEIDHTIPWSRQGPTDHGNLACECKRHHLLKSEGILHAEQPEPGTINWTSPAGKNYQTKPEPPPF